MLGLPARGSLAPHPKRRGLHLGSHELDHLTRSESKLGSDGIERRPILPGHLDNSIDVGRGQLHSFNSVLSLQ